jgi:hypothetical protein
MTLASGSVVAGKEPWRLFSAKRHPKTAGRRVAMLAPAESIPELFPDSAVEIGLIKDVTDNV